jgi:ATP-dependent Clp protease protease subunit
MSGFDFLAIPEKYSSVDVIEYQYFHQMLDNRTIIFNSEISEDIVETLYLPLRDFENDDSDEPITIILNSVGGSVSDGFFLANYLASYKKKINLIVAGYAASMAAVILSAGGKNDNITRYCYPSTYVLIHDGYVALSASEAKTANDIMAFNNLVDENIRKFIITNTNITEELYDSKARKQWFISAEEALELNLIDKIME